MQQRGTYHAARTCFLLAEDNPLPPPPRAIPINHGLSFLFSSSGAPSICILPCSSGPLFSFFCVYFLCIPGKILALALYAMKAFPFYVSFLQDQFHILWQPTWMFLLLPRKYPYKFCLFPVPFFIAFVSFCQATRLICISLSNPYGFFFPLVS